MKTTKPVNWPEWQKKLRIHAKLSQREVAERLGVTPETVSRWESGKGAPGPAELSKLADILNVSADFLLGRDQIRMICFDGKEGCGWTAVLNEDDAVFLDLFRKLTPAGKKKLMAYAEDLKKIPEYGK